MQDTELYRHLLGVVAPWSVARVELSVKDRRVDVFVEHGVGELFACPECGKPLTVYDHVAERSWRHLDSCQFQTLLRARIPRVACAEHGVRQVRVPWAEARARFTLLFERFAIDVLLETDVSGAATILGITWDEALHLMERAVARGQAAKPKQPPARLGVDEKAVGRGQDYVTIVCDLEKGTVEEVVEKRTTESLASYYRRFTPEQLGRIEAVAMDMWEPFAKATLTAVPGAAKKIVFDPFHIVKHMNEAVDTVRRRETRALRAAGDARLTGTRYLWLYGQENVPEHQRERFEAVRAADLKTARAWALKESLRDWWTCPTKEAAESYWKLWYGWAWRSRLDPVRKVGRMLRDHLPNVLTYFTHRITNAVSEGLNSAIQMLKHRAFGYRNRGNFRTAILFHCGGLQLHPVTHTIPG